MSAAAGPLVAAILLAAVYLLGHRLLPHEQKFPRRWLSLSAGASMAYVSMDVVPELDQRHRALLEKLGEVSFAEHRIYIIALAGFILLYGLDELVLAARGEEDTPTASGRRPGAPSSGRTSPDTPSN